MNTTGHFSSNGHLVQWMAATLQLPVRMKMPVTMSIGNSILLQVRHATSNTDSFNHTVDSRTRLAFSSAVKLLIKMYPIGIFHEQLRELPLAPVLQLQLP